MSRSGRAMMEPMSADNLSADLGVAASHGATATPGCERVIALDVEGMMW